MEDMANAALPAGRATPRRRALFGLFDADGWGWASVKAAFWFVFIILFLGYIPDRAYYFTVNQTLDLGLLAWSPVNFCPPQNEDVPCPAPAGAVLPWHPSPTELDLPQPRTDAGAVQAGSRFFVVGGSDATGAATDSVYIAETTGVGNYAPFKEGPKLPAPRTDAAVVVYSGTVYVIGGRGADGKPTDTVYSLTPPLQGELPTGWTTVDALKLPGPLAGAAGTSSGDGVLLVGGDNGSGPQTAVWKSRFVTDKLTKWVQQPGLLYEPNVGGVAEVVGSYVWLMGGSNAEGPVKTVQRGQIGAVPAPRASASAAPSPSASAAPGAPTTDAAQVTQWAVSEQTNLPEPRANPAGFTANGTLYVMGGSDGKTPKAELYWSIPDATGSVPGWRHLAQSDLEIATAGGGALGSGAQAFVFGGTTTDGVTAKVQRANLAPQAPFFQLGLVGATVPALKIDGEIGQQLGYLNAAGAGTVNFIILLLIGWAFAHKERTRQIFENLRNRRRRRREG
jgi:hypothetical protein